MRLALLPLLLLAASSTGCRKPVSRTSPTVAVAVDTLVAGTVIRSAGTWSAQSAKDSHRLQVMVNGTSVSWNLFNEEKFPGGRTSGGSTSSGTTLSSPADPWFIFVESPRRLWLFDGTNELGFNLSDRSGKRNGPAIFDGKLQSNHEKIPPDLVPLLPPGLQKLIPPAEPKAERPSF